MTQRSMNVNEGDRTCEGSLLKITKQKNNSKPFNKWVYKPDTSKSCFIGRISIYSKAADLQQLIEEKHPKFKIKSVHFVVDKVNPSLNKGFGFITLLNPNQMNKFMKLKIVLDGRELEIKPANDYEETNERKKPKQSNRVYLRGFNEITTQDDLQKFLETKWEIIRCSIYEKPKTNELLGFADFKNRKDAEDCLGLGSFQLDQEWISCHQSLNNQNNKKSGNKKNKRNAKKPKKTSFCTADIESQVVEEYVWTKKKNASEKKLEDPEAIFKSFKREKENASEKWSKILRSQATKINENELNYKYNRSKMSSIEWRRKNFLLNYVIMFR